MPALRTPPSGPVIAGTAPGDVLVWSGSEWLPAALPPPPPPSPPDRIVELPVNTAAVDRHYQDGSAVLRTGSNANPAGAFNGGGTGNKAILGVSGFSGLPIALLSSVSLVWESELGPMGPNAIPPEAVTTVTPYLNLIVQFDPAVPDLRVLVGFTDQLPAVSPFLGTYLNNGSNLFTYSWNAATDGVLIVASGLGLQRGVAPAPSGGAWTDNVYSWAALVAANPAAILIDAFPATTAAPPAPGGDGGMPVGATVPAIVIASGDSGTVIKSGKRLVSLAVNGIPIAL